MLTAIKIQIMRWQIWLLKLKQQSLRERKVT
jgi:hypothetical protein